MASLSAIAASRFMGSANWMPGTFVAMTLWAIVSWAFGTYVRTIGDYAVYYGSLATVAVTLLWLYLTSLSLLVGAEVNALLEGTREVSPSSHEL